HLSRHISLRRARLDQLHHHQIRCTIIKCPKGVNDAFAYDIKPPVCVSAAYECQLLCPTPH
ncbi:MAG: hypothetical protein OXC58_04415, partial [Acidimicrobiaceae bacterium]|nr:hypothetical protein [Acidimicrobiaceae bacterium]